MLDTRLNHMGARDMGSTRFRSPWMLLAALWLLTCVVYLPSFDVPFTFDDIPNIVGNERVQPESFADLAASLNARGGDDRPVAMFSFALNHLADGLDVFGYHLVNLLVHLVNATLLFAALRMCCEAMARHQRPVPEDRAVLYLAFFAAAIWALHPLNTQAVVYIVQRMTALATAFYLGAMLAFAAWRAGRLRAGGAAAVIAACFVLGMGSKAIVATLPAALWLMDVILFGRWNRLHKAVLTVMAAGALLLTTVYVGWRPSDFTTTLPGRDFSAWDRVLTEGRVLWHYLGLYVWPLPGRLQLDYAWMHSTGWLAPSTTLFAWVALAGVTALAFALARRWPWPAFAWLFFMAASGIEASFLNLELVFEHRMYLPSAFLAMGLLAALPNAVTGRHAWMPRMAMLLLLCLLGAGTIERNRQWADVGGFWAGELERGASLSRSAVNAASRYNRTGHPERALAVLDRAQPHAQGRDRYLVALHRADALVRLGRHDEAERVYRRQMARAARTPTRLIYGLGQVLLAQGRIDEAQALAREASQALRGSLFLTALDASVARARGRPQEAVANLQAFLDDHPDLPPGEEAVLRFHMANAFHALDQTDAAYREYRRIIERNPENWEAWVKIHAMLQAGGDTERARQVAEFLRARGIDPAAIDTSTPGR